MFSQARDERPGGPHRPGDSPQTGDQLDLSLNLSDNQQTSPAPQEPQEQVKQVQSTPKHLHESISEGG